MPVCMHFLRPRRGLGRGSVAVEADRAASGSSGPGWNSGQSMSLTRPSAGRTLNYVTHFAGRAGRSPTRALVAAEICLVATLLLVGCGGDATEGSGSDATAPRTSLAPPQRAYEFEGRFEVNGHELFLDCDGSGSPTVVHLHGLGGSHRNSAGIWGDLASATRFCSYDRTNMGDSDKPGRRQTAHDSVRELHALVSATNIDGPLVLVGASFGGLIATMYAATYPEDVAGMVLLDATLPSVAPVDRLIPPRDRRRLLAQVRANPERMDVPASLAQARRLMPRVPDVPMTYLAARPVELPASWPRKLMIAALDERTQQFVAAFPQGRLVEVESPHYMEPAVPDRIVAEVNRVIERAH